MLLRLGLRHGARTARVGAPARALCAPAWLGAPLRAPTAAAPPTAAVAACARAAALGPVSLGAALAARIAGGPALAEAEAAVAPAAREAALVPPAKPPPDPDAPPNADAADAGDGAAAALPSEAPPAPALAGAAAEVTSSRVWWRVLMEMSEDAWLFVAAMLASVVAAVAGVRSAQHIGHIFDIMSDGGPPTVALAPAVASLVAVYAVRALFTFVSATLLSMGVNRLSTRLQVQLVGALLEQDMAYFDGAKGGALAASVTADVKEATAALKHVLQNGLQMLTAVLGGALSLWALSRRLSLVILTSIPVTTLAFRQFGAVVRTLSRRERAAAASAAAIVGESVSNIRTVQSFVAERLEARRFAEEVDGALALRHSLGMLRGAFFGCLAFALHGVTALVVAVGGTLVSRAEMTHGDVSAFLAQTREVIGAVGGITRLADEARDGAHAMRRVVELLEARPSVLVRADDGIGGAAPSSPGLAPAAAVRGQVSFRGVHFAYPRRADVPVLRGLDLELEAGKVTALVGDSGAGKTTVAWLLERFYEPDGGEILLDGVPLHQYDVRWLRRRIGLVSQEPVLFATTIAKNILYGRPDASADEVRAAAARANAHKFIGNFPEGYAKRLGAGGAGLSGGQKQRVAIARALLKEPSILILDEATSALDAHSERVVLDALDSGLLDGRTTLVIAHRLSTVKRADKIAVLQEGRVVEQGTHAELIARGGVYASLVKLQLATHD